MIAHQVTSGDGTKLAVFEQGPSQAPTLLFSHGWSQHHLSWSKQKPLAKTFRLLSWDHRGHGASDKPLNAEAYNHSAPWAGDVQAILDQLCSGPVILVGWSMGGWVAMDYLRTHGDARLSGLCLIGSSVTTGRYSPPEVFAQRSNDPVLAAKGMYSRDQEENLNDTVDFVRICFHQQPAPDDFARMVGFNMMVPPEAREAARRRHEDYRITARATRIPTLIHWGEHDRLAPSVMGQEAVQAFPNAKALAYDDCGHAPFWEAADRFNADLTTFAQHCFQQVPA